MRTLLAVVLAASSCLAVAQTPSTTTAVMPGVFAHAVTPAEVAALIGPAAAKLKPAAGLRGSFTQRKFLKELPQPLVSSGDFIVVRGQGVAWHTKKPFDAELVLTPQALIQRSGSGKATHVDAAQQPGLRTVSQVFDALFALDPDTLAQTFTLYGERAGGGWMLGLVPREAALAQRIARIVIDGAEQPRRITLYEAGGDRTEIEFGTTAVLATLGAAERQPFIE